MGRPVKDLKLPSGLKVRITTPGPRARMARDGVIPSWKRALILEAVRNGEKVDAADYEPDQQDVDRATQRYICACTLPGKGAQAITADYPPGRGELWFDDLAQEDWDALCSEVLAFAEEHGATDEKEAERVRPLSRAESA